MRNRTVLSRTYAERKFGASDGVATIWSLRHPFDRDDYQVICQSVCRRTRSHPARFCARGKCERRPTRNLLATAKFVCVAYISTECVLVKIRQPHVKSVYTYYIIVSSAMRDTAPFVFHAHFPLGACIEEYSSASVQ